MPLNPIVSEAMALAPGDTFVLFSDGVSEATNPNDDFFGEDRLLANLDALDPSAPADIVRNTLQAVREFAGAAPQSDDITILAARYRSATFPHHKTKIVATIGPASDSPEMLERLIGAGSGDRALELLARRVSLRTSTLDCAHPRRRACGRPARRHHGGLARPEDARWCHRSRARPLASRRCVHADQ